MTNINDEMGAADRAETVIRKISSAGAPSEFEVAVQSLRTANDIAITAAGANPLAQEQLNKARTQAAIELSALIDELNRNSPKQDTIDRARRAVEDWKSKVVEA